jgi:mRNA interferase YafQ
LREIRRSSRFKKDFKKAKKQRKNIQLLKDVIDKLAEGQPLPRDLKDHKLVGEYKEYRELHLTTDWLLIYKITPSELRLARLGSHSELFS